MTMTKLEILRLINKEWQQLVGKVSSLPRELLEKPDLLGEWSVKDLMGHISYREGIVLERLSAVLEGGMIELVSDNEAAGMEDRQVKILRAEPLEKIQREFEVTHSKLVRAIDQLPESTFQSDDQDFREWLSKNTFIDYGEHHQIILQALAKLDHQ